MAIHLKFSVDCRSRHASFAMTIEAANRGARIQTPSRSGYSPRHPTCPLSKSGFYAISGLRSSCSRKLAINAFQLMKRI